MYNSFVSSVMHFMFTDSKYMGLEVYKQRGTLSHFMQVSARYLPEVSGCLPNHGKHLS